MASEVHPDLKHGPQHLPADSSPLMRGSDGDLIDPQLCRLVRMDVMNAGDEPHDDAIIHRHYQMVAVIVKEFIGQVGLELIVEHPVCDAGQEGGISGTDEPDVHDRRRVYGADFLRKAATFSLMNGFAASSPPPPATCPQREGIGVSSTLGMNAASARASETGKYRSV